MITKSLQQVSILFKLHNFTVNTFHHSSRKLLICLSNYNQSTPRYLSNFLITKNETQQRGKSAPTFYPPTWLRLTLTDLDIENGGAVSDEPACEEADVVMQGHGGRLENDTHTAWHTLEVALNLTSHFSLRLQVLPIQHVSMLTVNRWEYPEYLEYLPRVLYSCVPLQGPFH